ncbi:MAG: hypothetical protein ABI112_02370 [Terracoccus sp.]
MAADDRRANERAGFIDALLTGMDHNPASAMYAETPSADTAPRF